MRKLLTLTWLLILLLGIMPASVLGQGDDPVAPPAGTDLPLVEVVYEADFTDTGEWLSGSTENMSAENASNGYTITSLEPDGGIGLISPIDLSIDDFYAELSFTIDACQVPESALLFLTRLTPDAQNALQTDAYVFVQQCDGNYRSRAISLGTPGEIDAEGRQSASLDEGSAHIMGILMVDNSVTWYLDGAELATYDVLSPIRANGVFTLGAQRGLSYTATAWRIWSVESSGPAQAGPPPSGGTVEGDDPLRQVGVGDLIYNPDLGQPGSIKLGLNQPIAAIVVGGDDVGMYNTQPTAIMEFEDVQGSDYYVEIAFATRACTDASFIGLVWRASADFDSFYVFGIQCDGSYRARLVSPSGVSEPFVTGQATPAPAPDTGGYTLGVYVQGNTAWLYYADTLIGSFSDDTLTEGGVGLLLQSDPATDKAMDIVTLSLVVAEVE